MPIEKWFELLGLIENEMENMKAVSGIGVEIRKPNKYSALLQNRDNGVRVELYYMAAIDAVSGEGNTEPFRFKLDGPLSEIVLAIMMKLTRQAP